MFRTVLILTKSDKSLTPDEQFMQAALKAALKGRFTTSPNPRVGCVMVRDGEIISTGWHMRRGGPHAEVAAIDLARERGISLVGSTCYVTLEPCSHFGTTPPCANALVNAGIERVVAASEDPNPLVSGQGFNFLRSAGLQVTVGILETAAIALNPGFFSRMKRNRPYVRVKIAASLDGRMALANGASKWITQAEAREDVHRLRGLSTAVLTGAGTVRADDPRLTVRSPFVSQSSEGQVRQPLRIVLSGRQAIPAASQIFHDTEARTLLVAADGYNSDIAETEQVQHVACRTVDGRIDLTALLTTLSEDYQINELLVEAGPTLASRFLAERLCDELWWYSGALLLGADARAAIDALGHEEMTGIDRMSIRNFTRLGSDTRTILSCDSGQRSTASVDDLQTELYHWTTED